MYAIPIRPAGRKAEAEAITSPEAAHAAIARIREAVDGLAGVDEPDAARTHLLAIHADTEALRTAQPETGTADDWADVGAAIKDLNAWLAEPVEQKSRMFRTRHVKATLTREEQVRIAVAIAGRGRVRAGGGRRRDAADMILDGFYGGLRGLIWAAGATLRLTAIATYRAGELLGRGIQAAAEAADDGIVDVAGYTRSDGTEVAGYERTPPKA